MREMIEEIKGSRGHQLVLGTIIILTVLAGIWKFTPKTPHVTDRQQAIEQAVKGF